MRKERTNKRSHVALIALVTLMMFSLSACGSAATKGEETSEVEEVTEPATEAETEVTEPATEAAPKPAVVYEGIDMESDLPGEEWIKTFIGVVDEPVAIIYNDNTGRKEIIQEGATVNFNADEDTIAVYLPDDNMESNFHVPMKVTTIYGNYEIHTPDAAKLRNAPISERPTAITVTGGAEDWVVNFTIVVE